MYYMYIRVANQGVLRSYTWNVLIQKRNTSRKAARKANAELDVKYK